MPKLKGISNSYFRNFCAEFLGTFALVVFGDGAIAQVVLGNAIKGSQFFGGFLNICFGYGLALMIGILISGGVSGGHLNPAVTVAMALLKKVSLKQVPVYFAGQFLGAFCAALVLWGIYADAINMVEASDYSMGTAGIFASYPTSPTLGAGVLAMDQMLGTALLVIIILAVTDDRNMKVNSSMTALLIGLGLTAIHLSFGMNAGSAVNPARDFAPRLMTLMAGWPKATFEGFNYFFWIPTFLPFLGGIVGAGTYCLLISLHHPTELQF